MKDAVVSSSISGPNIFQENTPPRHLIATPFLFWKAVKTHRLKVCTVLTLPSATTETIIRFCKIKQNSFFPFLSHPTPGELAFPLQPDCVQTGVESVVVLCVVAKKYIKSFVPHCTHSAAEGGTNDHSFQSVSFVLSLLHLVDKWFHSTFSRTKILWHSEALWGKGGEKTSRVLVEF